MDTGFDGLDRTRRVSSKWGKIKQRGNPIMLDLFRTWKERHFSDPQRLILGFMLLVGAGLVYFLGPPDPCFHQHHHRLPCWMGWSACFSVPGIPRLPPCHRLCGFYGGHDRHHSVADSTDRQTDQPAGPATAQHVGHGSIPPASAAHQLSGPDLRSPGQAIIDFLNTGHIHAGQTGVDIVIGFGRGASPPGGLSGAGAVHGLFHAEGQGR
jgi:hypothetical protein